MKGIFPGYGKVWYQLAAFTNIISQSGVEDKGYKVQYQPGKYTVSGKKGKIYFKRIPQGLYILKLSPIQKQGVTLVETVEENKKGYTQRQIARADRARHLQETIMFPSIQDLKTMIQMNAIKNCPVTIEDIKLCEKIYGRSIPSLKGKTVRRPPKITVNDYLKIPKELKLSNYVLTLCISKELFSY